MLTFHIYNTFSCLNQNHKKSPLWQFSAKQRKQQIIFLLEECGTANPAEKIYLGQLGNLQVSCELCVSSTYVTDMKWNALFKCMHKRCIYLSNKSQGSFHYLHFGALQLLNQYLMWWLSDLIYQLNSSPSQSENVWYLPHYKVTPLRFPLAPLIAITGEYFMLWEITTAQSYSTTTSSLRSMLR